MSKANTTPNEPAYEAKNFIEEIIDKHNEQGRFNNKVHTRFPPEPNGYLHIGHAMAINTSFTIANQYGGQCNLRLDDTNPLTEDEKYVEAIKKDIKWLGFDWGNRLYYASDYFEQLYQWAKQLIAQGKAYVDDSTPEALSEMRGTPATPGTPSQYRNRTPEENLQLFEGMRNGKYEEGSRVLRAKIDLSSPNMLLRDPIMYRIMKTPHYRTGTQWSIYPTYDWAHGQSDSIEGITHSLCSLEFEVHRPLYNWFIEQLNIHHPQQIEFGRMNVDYMITSKRRLKQLVEQGHVNGWDDPRMPTISGMRRRGYTPQGIRNFIERAGIARRTKAIDIALLEFSVREHLNHIAPRYMAVLNPLKITITNYPEDKVEDLPIENNPEQPETGNRLVKFSRELYIERDDFRAEPQNRKYFRLAPNKAVRLKGAYIIECEEIIKDEAGEVLELKCRYIENSKSGNDTSGVKVKGTIHWVSVPHALPIQVNLYDRLFLEPNPLADPDKDFTEFLNPNSLKVVSNAFGEAALASVAIGEPLQFIRKGYFTLDKDSANSNKPIFNRTVTLRDNWARKK